MTSLSRFFFFPQSVTVFWEGNKNLNEMCFKLCHQKVEWNIFVLGFKEKNFTTNSSSVETKGICWADIFYFIRSRLLKDTLY